MLGHYLLTLYRSLSRHRLYAALNMFGLAVGIAVFLALWLDVRFETSFEQWIPHAAQVYEIRTRLAPLEPLDETMGDLLVQLRAENPQLVGTRLIDTGATVREGARVDPERLEQVDPNFFQVFDLPLVAGDKAALFRQPSDLVLSEAKAKRYFGTSDPIGRNLTLAYDGQVQVFRVAGVLKDPPASTDLSFDFLTSFTPPTAKADPSWRSWGNIGASTYVRLASPDQARALDTELDRLVDERAGAALPPKPHTPPHQQLSLRTQSLLSLHLINPKDRTVVAALGAVGLLTLLLAAVNYVNLATAQAVLRAREVAMRRVMGATGPILVAQFMAESVASTAMAALLGLALCEAALPLVNAAGGLSLRIAYLGPQSVLWPLAGVVLAVGLGAGVYPALVLTRFRPAAVLASARSPGGGRAGGRVREALVAFQFTVAIAFAVATGVIVAQTDYIRHADLGFNRQGLVLVHSFDNDDVSAAQRASLLTAWRALPGVKSAAAAGIGPASGSSISVQNIKPAGTPGIGPMLNIVTAGPDFFQTYGARLQAGRLPDRDHGGDLQPPVAEAAPTGAAPSAASTQANVVINARAARLLGFRSAQAAVGHRLEGDGGYIANVIGVIDDLRFRSPRAPVAPTLYFSTLRDVRAAVAVVRYSGVDPRAMTKLMAERWRAIAPAVPFRAKTAEDSLNLYYRPESQHGRLFTMGAGLALLIGCVGLYGLASFTTARRTREIGIRKTLGASTRDVVGLLIGQFLRPVVVANVVAWPLAWFVMQGWLSGFDQRIGLGPQYFLGATALTLLIALGTVAGQAMAVARAEPGKALRYE